MAEFCLRFLNAVAISLESERDTAVDVYFTVTDCNFQARTRIDTDLLIATLAAQKRIPNQAEEAEECTICLQPFKGFPKQNQNEVRINLQENDEQGIGQISICKKYSDFTDLNIGPSNLTLIVRGTLIESNMHSSIAEQHKKVMEGQIYEVSQFQVRQNNRRYKLTPHKYIIQVTRETTIVVVDKKIPQIPINNFWIKKYKELLLLTGTKSELPDVIGKIRIIQGTDLRNSQYNTKILVGLQLSRNTIVRLIIWDDQASKFRETLCIKDRMDEKNNPFIDMEKALEDDKRIRYHRDYLSNLTSAIRDDGCDVREYFMWSLLDNWEWNSGYTVRFRVYYVDYKSREISKEMKGSE
ncbi:unnamed protein product [Thlaspi arvense]|uniref:Uncharacterized protein n=1 Tax=Thlaspi arvense TaxID=13288 RepID=A0AAU9RSW3_THLAR|nr:unnamed protein product [Thlaspi arvense]